MDIAILYCLALGLLHNVCTYHFATIKVTELPPECLVSVFHLARLTTPISWHMCVVPLVLLFAFLLCLAITLMLHVHTCLIVLHVFTDKICRRVRRQIQSGDRRWSWGLENYASLSTCNQEVRYIALLS